MKARHSMPPAGAVDLSATWRAINMSRLWRWLNLSIAERSGDLIGQAGGTQSSPAPERRMLPPSPAGLTPPPDKKSFPRPWMPWLLRDYRLSIVLALVWLVHLQSRWFATRAGGSISIRQARKFFPAA